MHGDIVYSKELFTDAYKHYLENDNDMELVTDYSDVDEEAMKVRVTKAKLLLESNKEISLDESDGEWTGIAFVRKSKDLFKYIQDVMFEDGLNYYDTFAFSKMSNDGYRIYCHPTNSRPWIEVDFINDYSKAREMF